jgi:acyl carrier protein
VSELESKVKKIIAEKLAVSEDKISPQASFVDDLGADSLDQVELIMAFEDAFDVEIPDEDAEKLKSVKDAVEYLQGKL